LRCLATRSRSRPGSPSRSGGRRRAAASLDLLDLGPAGRRGPCARRANFLLQPRDARRPAGRPAERGTSTTPPGSRRQPVTGDRGEKTRRGSSSRQPSGQRRMMPKPQKDWPNWNWNICVSSSSSLFQVAGARDRSAREGRQPGGPDARGVAQSRGVEAVRTSSASRPDAAVRWSANTLPASRKAARTHRVGKGPARHRKQKLEVRDRPQVCRRRRRRWSPADPGSRARSRGPCDAAGVEVLVERKPARVP